MPITVIYNINTNTDRDKCVPSPSQTITTLETIDDIPAFKTKGDYQIIKVLDNDHNDITQKVYDTVLKNDTIKCTGTYGGSKKRTQKKIKVQGKERVVYKGPRGGEYVKVGGAFKSLKSL